MAAFRGFGIPFLITAIALVVGYVYGGLTALFLLIVLAILEVSLSFDNAIINAAVLKQMSQFWRKMFLTIGILIAAFGMGLVFPVAAVWATAALDPVRAMDLALHPPPNHALEFPDGSPSYQKLITSTHPQIAAFGGMFLLMLFLDFVFQNRDIKWIEVPFARIGRLAPLLMVAIVVLVLIATVLTHSGDKRAKVLIAGFLGLVTYLLVKVLSRAFRPPDIDTASGRGGTSRAGLAGFLYLEVLDAAFSFDGVTGAFAITSDPVIIALGLGLIGSMFIRSITIYLVHQDALDRYVYLEYGAHWAIGALSVMMLISVEPRFEILEAVTALVGVLFVGAALTWSVFRNHREFKACT
ncbi:DUF475 domain-containing protein [Mycobacterium lepromatosis]|uniref:Integral membrane protein n=1 Tax=Mycobacterium lepromatosis TaxID=480418 RepID=A0A0F4ESJ4_9MYCO|nr:DUF475 domain-containing protein [Mycobacterium lepromatosis]KJX75804.1 hypothetical protein MLPM_0205 [Mycobacterium lepromatosis]UKN41594.1 membrane protein [Mycobacterium lepromatosis]